ncbi:MmgE/PrpD family protein [Ensifer sp. ENS05]|uniref:MmgE/PrpD family protein n=1 Tax=Ensifer sp. ENS05 TaxID=2769277 RepID=UPI00178293E6|nr:MmgE/PrpD family protein [Ensifer sp. ENS05]MBD9597295.1 MmgE/PrpD family protein [Ensifer sp. ENS05]
MTSTSISHDTSPSSILAKFAAELELEAVPARVVARAEDFFVDWIGSALGGKGSNPVERLSSFAREMGPKSGPCEILIDGSSSSSFFAALVNGAASHVAEQDDVHNGSVFHPATVVFPAALAVAQEIGASGREFVTAAVAGYEVGIRAGEFMGRSHYRQFHTTGTMGTLAAAAAAGRLLRLSPDAMLDAFGSAGTQAAGLWEFLRDAADSKPLHAGKAAANGVASAWLARHGFRGARQIFEGKQGLGAGMSADADVARLTDGLGNRWALEETSFKFHASCRHTHPAADALLKVMTRHSLAAEEIKDVAALVHQGAIDVLGQVDDPVSVHQAKFSMGTTLGLIGVFGRAGLNEFERHYRDDAVRQFANVVRMELDPEVDAVYPARWIGKVKIRTRDGRIIEERVDEPKGDPGNTLSRLEIEEKVHALAAFGGAMSHAQMAALLPRIWAVTAANDLTRPILACS